MGRLVILFLVNVGAGAVLRSLWPGLLRGWRLGVFAFGALLSLAVWYFPLLAGHQAELPVGNVALRVFSAGWSIAAIIVVLLGTPIALLSRWVERGARARALAASAKETPAPATAPASGPVLSRRSLLTNTGRAVPVLAVGTSSVGMASGVSGFTVREVEVRLPNLPKAMDGFRIGQITDVHVGNFIDTGYLHDAVRAMNEAGVDLQVMTGDLIDDLDQLDGTMEALSACKARHGMLAVLGNHEHWRGLRAIRRAYADVEARGGPVKLLVDASHDFEHEGQRVRVVGVDYPMSGRSHRVKAERMAQSAEVAFRGASPDEVMLCLTHHPDFFPLAAERGARLTLAGHTHGGQVAFLGVPAFWFAFKYMLGRYRQGDHQLYVSGGTGHWLPFRLGVPTEVTVLTLRAA
ncbi:metallophosphoesterase [Pyxidicoccus fallax]|uniref:Metallophosphoesterase n=1 Tax=Pyxidicoccus fallax TaxID=394095 RepID=A0A848LQE7_9BACT|nr:metallophosphoesterase [Pyxidicoccus fallax]NMO20117.1 metallophosphoesterase [Pyxidicoccus fallax]NPC80842.1 metallophosphoesterase [Pyxidicoccus fallax]